MADSRVLFRDVSLGVFTRAWVMVCGARRQDARRVSPPGSPKWARRHGAIICRAAGSLPNAQGAGRCAKIKHGVVEIEIKRESES